MIKYFKTNLSYFILLLLFVNNCGGGSVQKEPVIPGQGPYAEMTAKCESPKANELYLNGSCNPVNPALCYDDEISKKIFLIWKEEFRLKHNFSMKFMESNVFIQYVRFKDQSIQKEETELTWEIGFDIVVDGLIGRHSNQFEILTDKNTPSDEEIRNAVKNNVGVSGLFDTDNVVSAEIIEAALAECSPTLEVNWCRFYFIEDSNSIHVPAKSPNDYTKCGFSPSVNINKGELAQCHLVTDCAID